MGCYFFADDFIRFISKLEYYLSKPVRIISAEESKYYAELRERGEETVPIGLIDDVEIVFLHYKSPEEAVEKWERRKNRVDYNHLIIKFSRMNKCTDEHLMAFDDIDYEVKFAFNNREIEGLDSIIYIPGYDDSDQIRDDTKHYNDYIDLEQLINEHIVVSKNAEK